MSNKCVSGGQIERRLGTNLCIGYYNARFKTRNIYSGNISQFIVPFCGFMLIYPQKFVWYCIFIVERRIKADYDLVFRTREHTPDLQISWGNFGSFELHVTPLRHCSRNLLLVCCLCDQSGKYAPYLYVYKTSSIKLICWFRKNSSEIVIHIGSIK